MYNAEVTLLMILYEEWELLSVKLLRIMALPVLFILTALIMYAISRVANWGWECLLFAAFTLFGIARDRKPIGWLRFLPAGLIMLTIFYLIYRYANPMWNWVVGMQTKSIRHVFNWNDLFNSIPLNDAAFFRLWQPKWLTHYMQWVYSFGFALSYWICLIRAFFTKDVHKFGRYALAGYLLQVPFILLFYNTILLQEVWYVQGTPDLLERGLSAKQAFSTAMNCFPSMHTSIAFAGLLLSMREQSRWYKLVLGTYCISIIVSTMYLKIHWVIDVIAGMLFAYCCVKLADWIVASRPYGAFAQKFEGLGERLESAVSSDWERRKQGEEAGEAGRG